MNPRHKWARRFCVAAAGGGLSATAVPAESTRIEAGTSCPCFAAALEIAAALAPDSAHPARRDSAAETHDTCDAMLDALRGQGFSGKETLASGDNLVDESAHMLLLSKRGDHVHFSSVISRGSSNGTLTILEVDKRLHTRVYQCTPNEALATFGPRAIQFSTRAGGGGRGFPEAAAAVIFVAAFWAAQRFDLAVNCGG